MKVRQNPAKHVAWLKHAADTIKGETVISRHGALVQVFIGDDDSKERMDELVAAHIKKELSRGYDVKYKGVTQWLDWRVIADLSKPEADAYIWDRSGERAKHSVALVSRDSDGNITREDKGTTWRQF